MTECVPCHRCGERERYGSLGWCYECLTEGMDTITAERIGPRPASQAHHGLSAEEFRVWLPFPVSTNNLFTHGRVRGKIRRFPAKRYKAWRTEALTLLRAAWRSKPPYTDKVVVKLQLVPPDKRARDADNYAKPVLDALVEARVLTDDSNRYVTAVRPCWELPAKQAGVIVHIQAAAAESRG